MVRAATLTALTADSSHPDFARKSDVAAPQVPLDQHQQTLLGMRNFDRYLAAVTAMFTVGRISGIAAIATVAAVGSPRIPGRIPTAVTNTARLSVAAAASIAAFAAGHIKKEISRVTDCQTLVDLQTALLGRSDQARQPNLLAITTDKA